MSAGMAGLSAEDVIALLGLEPHPEGGHFRETFRESAPDGGRGASTAIYFLLKAGERSHWHRVDASEVWHWHAGAALTLAIAPPGGGGVRHLRLGTDLGAGERPQGVVPPGHWQAAESLGAWTLVGCTVAPAFDFAGFELAPPDFEP
ncbi:cupin domain-containing protein [Roseixanthobacter glucoisosaccharinicivorans]|uniref:cupin domain-containing protein n=1 Tax=Roseixanthobacter glucoisosaccharinicivorans TaxID=3119923 RepID=UPI0037271483